MKQIATDDSRPWQSEGHWSKVPTIEQPDGWIETMVNESNGLVSIVCHDNDTIAAWATDMTPEFADRLGRQLMRAANWAQLATFEQISRNRLDGE